MKFHLVLIYIAQVHVQHNQHRNAMTSIQPTHENNPHEQIGCTSLSISQMWTFQD